MQLRGLLFLGLLAGTEASRIVRRQDATGSSDSGDSAVQPTVADTSADSVSSTDAVVVSTTSVDETTSSSAPADDTSSSAPADETTTSDSADTTITRTITVTGASGDTITKKSTVQKTVTSTVVVYSTAFKTETVTSSGETATSTVYVTSTTWTNEKRDLAPRTLGLDDYVFVDAKPTAAAELPEEDALDLKALLRRNHLAKRATITDTVTVTVGGSDGKTVTNVVTQTVVSSTSSVSKITKTVTETEAAGASTTITVTSTLVITSTRVTTGVVATQSVAETSSSGSSSDSSSGSSSSSSSGLSTGAKAGIGAGAGVVGLAALGIILWCCLKKRNKPSKSEIDDMFGSSEVPVGGRGGNGTSPHMAHANHGSESGLAPGRMPTMSSTAEGYRGTAIGDGRTGYAKPNTYGAAYNGVSPETTYSRTTTKSPGGDDHLPEHPSAAEMHSPANTAELGTDNLAAAKWHQPNAAEIDSTQVSSPRGSEPAEHVYEMPAQSYR
ncbi:hypothetical protein EDB80DRAFT_145774 [Ilyonectria destructans]|nr:hypothetical protein EDB80DRAFT_145774 [Ilyonectria destructans]